MNVFRSILFSSVIAGVVVGLLTTGAHMAGSVPLILKAEVYEQAETAPTVAAAAPAVATHDHAAAEAGHDHGDSDSDEWAPTDGWERTLYTALADILAQTGFALVLVSLYVISGRIITWREGLLWGLAGFTAVIIAPGLGLPPELPGMPASAVGPRQAWWIATALCTASGIALLAFNRRPAAAVAAVVLLIAPHLIGAPVQPDDATAVPHALWRQFVVTVTGLVFWALLGAITGALHQRFFSQAA